MSATAIGYLHAYGYEGEVEDAVPVQEIHRAECSLCDWKGQEHDGLAWKDAEEEAIEHYEEEHAELDDDEEDEDGDDPDA